MTIINTITAATKRDKSYLIGFLLTILALLLLINQHDWESKLVNNSKESLLSDLPDLSLVSNRQKQLQLLFDYLRPKIEKENNKIKYKQALLTSILNKLENESYHASSNYKKLHKLAKEYGVAVSNIKNNIEELKSRIDIIPTSLILAQAANEPDWRFSPFSHSSSIANYLRDLNSKEAYRDFRNIRAGLRRRGQRITGVKLAHGISAYSKPNVVYVNQIIKIINDNNLE